MNALARSARHAAGRRRSAPAPPRVQVPEVPMLDSLDLQAPRQSASQSRKPPVEYVEVPKPLPLPGQLKPLPKTLRRQQGIETGTPERRVSPAQQRCAKSSPPRTATSMPSRSIPTRKGALYQLYAAVNQVTDIALEPGEKLVSVSAGDTVRWVVGDTTSGEGKDAQVHILVKPIGADLDTNLVITTDRRTYHLELHSIGRDLHGLGVVDLSVRRSDRAQEAAQRCRAWQPPLPIPASTSSSCGSAIASRATRPGSRSRCSMTAPRSTSSSRPAWRRARPRRCS